VHGVFKAGATRTIDFINDPAFKTGNSQNIIEYIRARVPGITAQKVDGNYVFNYRNSGNLYGKTPMSIFLDGMSIDADGILFVRASDVAMIKVYDNFPGAPLNGAGGTLAIFTKRGNDVTYNDKSTMKKIKIAGYTPYKEFFSPDYSDAKQNTDKPDNRITLYWNPFLTTNAENKTINFSFYNNDSAKKLRVIIQGFTVNGQLLHFEKIIEQP